MFKFKQSASGFWSFSKNRRKDEILNLAASAAMKTALVDYATGKLADAKLRDRFKPSAFAMYGFSARSRKYMKRQQKYMGAATPYVSPRPVNLTRTALAITDLASGRGNPIALMRAIQNNLKPWSAPHMRDLITRPGGFTLRITGKRKSTVSIRYPGARILNRAGPRSETYRKELIDLNLGGRRDLLAILSRANEKYDEIVEDHISKAPKRRSA